MKLLIKSRLRVVGLVFVVFSVGNTLFAQERFKFNDNWKFKLGDEVAWSNPDFDDTDWRVLDVPHDWSIEGEYKEDEPAGPRCGYLPTGIGWYRKTIEVPETWKGNHVEIAFDGVFMNSTVWVNGQKLGYRPFGWISFSYDISDLVVDADQITFAVRVDNEKQPAARWYTGSGIYADTWIVLKGSVHIPNSGIFVRTDDNRVFVDTEVYNKREASSNAMLSTQIVDAEGVVLKSSNTDLTISNQSQENINEQFALDNPSKWSPDNPYLYQVISTITVDGELTDEVVTKFGVRDVEWIPETGMWLNDENVKMQGVCNHADAGALGVAVPDKILRFRLQQIKDMGANAIRTAHYPRPPAFYDICDEIGLLVMDEIFDGWRKKADHDYGAHHFEDWWKKDLIDWIKRDRNHPSIVIYSVGNETRGEVAKDLVEACHAVDSTRPVTSGHSGSEHMDVFGVNGVSEKVGWFDNLEKDRVFVGTENTHTWQVRGFYRTKTWYRNGYPNEKHKPHFYPDLTEEEVFSHNWTYNPETKNKKQVFNSSYDNAMVRLTTRHNIEQLRDIPNYAGSFRWTGHDYIGEAGFVHGGWPFKSFMGGAIDMANFEKDLYYLYQSQWTDEPMVHILPHWTHPTLEKGVEIPVWVYSNCEEVELFFNGQSLGTKKPGTKWEEMQCQWLVGWEPGELKAVARNKGQIVSEKVIKTAGSPAKIKLSVDGEGLTYKVKDIVQVRVTTTDETGEFYPYGENRTYFHVIGSGKIRALDNGSPIDTEKHFEAKDRNAFYGLTRAYIESTDEGGDIALLASCILGEKKQITSQKVTIDTEILPLRGDSPKAKIKIYYTTDGTQPSKKSKQYKEAFSVNLGTTVKALVVLNGEPVQNLKERFAEDEGFVFEVLNETK